MTSCLRAFVCAILAAWAHFPPLCLSPSFRSQLEVCPAHTFSGLLFPVSALAGLLPVTYFILKFISLLSFSLCGSCAAGHPSGLIQLLLLHFCAPQLRVSSDRAGICTELSCTLGLGKRPRERQCLSHQGFMKAFRMLWGWGAGSAHLHHCAAGVQGLARLLPPRTSSHPAQGSTQRCVCVGGGGVQLSQLGL